jgi:hypothetical protein
MRKDIIIALKFMGNLCLFIPIVGGLLFWKVDSTQGNNSFGSLALLLLFGIFAHAIAFGTMPKGVKNSFWAEIRLLGIFIKGMVLVAILVCALILIVYFAPNWKFETKLGAMTIGEVLGGITVVIMIVAMMTSGINLEKFESEKKFDELWPPEVNPENSWGLIFEKFGFADYGVNNLCRIELNNLIFEQSVSTGEFATELTMQNTGSKIAIYGSNSRGKTNEALIRYTQHSKQLHIGITISKDTFNLLCTAALSSKSLNIRFLTPLMSLTSLNRISANEPLQIKSCSFTVDGSKPPRYARKNLRSSKRIKSSRYGLADSPE